MNRDVSLEFVEQRQEVNELNESPAEFMQRLVVERPEYEEPCTKLIDMIDRGVPTANMYPAVFQRFYAQADKLPVAFPDTLRPGVSKAMHELLGNALYAVTHHLDNAVSTESAIHLSAGRELPVKFEGTQPLEILHTFTQAVDRIHHVMTDPEVKTAPVVQNADYHMYRFLDPDNTGAPAVHVYIRPQGAQRFDENYEYGRKSGVDPSISFVVDSRPLNHLARADFIGDITKRGPHAWSTLSIRADLDGYAPDDWSERLSDHDPTIEQGTLSLDGGSIFGKDSDGGRVGLLFGFGNELRSRAKGHIPSWNHVLSFDDELGRADMFASGALELVQELDTRRAKRRFLEHIHKPTSSIIESPAVNLEHIDPSSHPAEHRTASEVLDLAQDTQNYFKNELQADTVLHDLIASRFRRFDFLSNLDGPLLERAADILAPPNRSKARWEVLDEDSREFTLDEEMYFMSLARRLGLLTVATERADAIAIPNSEKMVLVEGGANETSVLRRANACQLVGNDPNFEIWQAGSGRHIPALNIDGSRNVEYDVVTSQKVAGFVLPHSPGYSEYEVNVASALNYGWRLDIPASEQARRLPGIQDAAKLRAPDSPDVMSILPIPAKGGRATLETAVRAMVMSRAFDDKSNLLVATTAQYAPKSTIQAARALSAMGMDDIRVQALGMPGETSIKIYAHETAVLFRLLAES